MKSKKTQIQHILKIIFMILIYLNSASFLGQDTMEDANILLSFSEDGNTKYITAIATDQEGQPIEDLELYFYVKRTLSLLPVGDAFNFTDENGKIEMEFPDDLPGDAEGNLTIITKIIDSDYYNDQSLETSKKWGIPVETENSQNEKRSLWAAAANAPITLVIGVSLMIIVVWSIFWYIVFNLYAISKIKPLKN